MKGIYLFRHVALATWFLFVLSLPVSVRAQSDQEKKLLKEGDAHFDKGNFSDALEVYKKIRDKTIKDDPLFCYRFGVSFFNSDLEKDKAIPYLENAWKSGDKRIPPETALILGELYHFKHGFKKAMGFYSAYAQLPEVENDVVRKQRLAAHIAITEYAVDLIWDSIPVDVRNLGLVVNSPWAEHSPVISADERILIFTATERQSVQDIHSKQALEDRIYISYKKDSIWTIPSLLAFEGNEEGDFGSVALYPDGQRLMIYRGSKHSGNIYECTVQPDSSWSKPEKITSISSKFWEGSASITPDENTIYFSSNRPGGYGGKDIYKVERTGLDTWTKPINLGPMINTDADEDAPFIHPDQKTLFFSSKGHKGMGGFDIFKSRKMNVEWTVPVNMGYPINSTGDDVYFVLSADGRNGYLASNRRGGFGDLDLYSLGMPSESIPLTMVRGKITAGDPPQPIKAKIKVIDRETNKKVRYVYNPNPKTGKYLMIFPPGKNYDMIIEAQGYIPHLVNIYVPHQTYFYELYQEIHLTEIMEGSATSKTDTVIGEQLLIRNTFYDVRNHLPDSDRNIYANYQQEYEPLLTLIEKLIAETDSGGLEHLEKEVEQMVDDTASAINEQDIRYSPLLSIIDQIIQTTDSIAMQNVDKITSNEMVQSNYLYSQGVQPYYFGDDTLYTTPGFNTFDTPLPPDSSSLPGTEIAENLKRITLFYPTGEVAISRTYHQDLQNLVNVLIQHPSFTVRVEGYTDEVGKEDANLELSRKRSEQVKAFLTRLGVPGNQISIRWYGEGKAPHKDSGPERKTVISLITE